MTTSSYRDFAEQIRAAADIAEVVGQYVELRRAGANLKACCPFHQEKTPSFNVHPGKQIFKCFGCGKGGDVISFVQEAERVDFREALEILAKRYGLEMPRFQGRSQEDEAVRKRQTLSEILERTAEYYQGRLRDANYGAHGRRYLAERGLSPATVEAFGLGVAGEDWDGLIRFLKGKGYAEESMVQAGVAIPKKSGEGFRDYLRDRLVFPIWNARGGVIAFGGRLFEGEGPKYLNTPETGLFQKGRELYGLSQARDSLTRQKRPAVLVEGYMDVIACHQAGVTEAVASMGTSLTEDQARLLKRYTDVAVFLYDGDEAGIKAILRGLEGLVKAGLTVRVGILPEGEDPDSYAKKEGPEALCRLIEHAPPFFDFLVLQAHKRFESDSPEARLGMVGLFEPVLSAIEEPIVFDGYVVKLAAELGIEEGALRQYLRKRLKQMEKRSSKAPVREAEPIPDVPFEEPDFPQDLGYETGISPAFEISTEPAPRREAGLLLILLDHVEARLIVRERLRLEWLTHPLARYWVGNILALEDSVSDVWRALTERAESPDHQKFLESVVFSSEEPLAEDYVAVSEHLMGILESDFQRTENRRLQARIQDLIRSGRQDEIPGLVEEQMRNLHNRVEGRSRATKENPCSQVKY